MSGPYGIEKPKGVVLVRSSEPRIFLRSLKRAGMKIPEGRRTSRAVIAPLNRELNESALLPEFLKNALMSDRYGGGKQRRFKINDDMHSAKGLEFPSIKSGMEEGYFSQRSYFGKSDGGG